MIPHKSARLRESGLLVPCPPQILRCAQDFVGFMVNPQDQLGRHRNGGFHVRVNVAVVDKCSRRCEGHHESLVLGQTTSSVKGSCITCDRMWSIAGVRPDYLGSLFNCQS